MEFLVLGPLAVVGDGGPSAPAGAKERAVLACLLLEPGRPVATETLLDAVWPDSAHDVATPSLNVRLAHLRAFLEPERPRGAPSTVLVHEASGYRVAIEPARVDAQRFVTLVRRAGSEPADSALGDYERALALWRGPPFPEIAHAEAAQAEIRRLGELRAQADAGRAGALVELGRHEAALPDLRRLVTGEPRREELVRTLALALYRAGRRREALDALRAHAGEPDPETRALEQRIRAHDA